MITILLRFSTENIRSRSRSNLSLLWAVKLLHIPKDDLTVVKGAKEEFVQISELFHHKKKTKYWNVTMIKLSKHFGIKTNLITRH